VTENLYCGHRLHQPRFKRAAILFRLLCQTLPTRTAPPDHNTGPLLATSGIARLNTLTQLRSGALQGAQQVVLLVSASSCRSVAAASRRADGAGRPRRARDTAGRRGSSRPTRGYRRRKPQRQASGRARPDAETIETLAP